MNRSILVCGATGFVGTHLMKRLADSGHRVVGATRRPDAARARHPDWAWTFADVEDKPSLQRAMEGHDTVVYLVHQMREDGNRLLRREQASAYRVRDAAERAGIQRVVYLGGPEPADTPSTHLKARLETGRILRDGSMSTIELRAGMIIGAESESWLIVRDLSLRLPIMVLPKWLKSRSQPIGIDDVVVALSHAISMEGDASKVFDLPGPETLTCREIIERVAGISGIRPVMVPVPVLTPALSSHWLRFVTRANFTVAKKLVQGLTGDIVATQPSFWTHIPRDPTPLDVAIKRALEAENRADRSWVARGWERYVRLASLNPETPDSVDLVQGSRDPTLT